MAPHTTPTQIIILGGGGDLSQRKLLPALFDLFRRDMLPEKFSIIGLARSARSDDEYRVFVKEALAVHNTPWEGKHHTLEDFCSHISYVTGAFGEKTTYEALQKKIEANEVAGGASHKLFYLAVPPKHYGEILEDLANSGVVNESDDTHTRILIEKPFGHNYATAQALDEKLATLYREDQIFRIDHYLAKEAVQNILSFRFANRLMTAPWNKNSIESITITMTETLDVGARANFYEGVGALRDVGQNHLLQILALIAMRMPEEFTDEAIRDKRAEVLKSLVPFDAERMAETVLRAQYSEYKTHENIPDTSETETYFELKTELALPEWEGVPFYIRAGKALSESLVQIEVLFKDVSEGMFKTDSCLTGGNRVVLTISPRQKTSITLNAKEPGLGFQVEPHTLTFTGEFGDTEIKNAYEKVLYDAIINDQTLFARTDEVLAAWQYVAPILENWSNLPLYEYEKGSRGPAEGIIPE